MSALIDCFLLLILLTLQLLQNSGCLVAWNHWIIHLWKLTALLLFYSTSCCCKSTPLKPQSLLLTSCDSVSPSLALFSVHPHPFLVHLALICTVGSFHSPVTLRLCFVTFRVGFFDSLTGNVSKYILPYQWCVIVWDAPITIQIASNALNAEMYSNRWYKLHNIDFDVWHHAIWQLFGLLGNTQFSKEKCVCKNF